MLIDVFLVISDKGLGDCLTDGIDLGSVTTTADADTDVDIGELVESDNEEGLVDLESKDLRLDEVKGGSVDLDQSTAGLAVGDSSSRLLLAEALDTGGWCRHVCLCEAKEGESR